MSFTGSQSGIITNDTHTNARITKVVPTRVRGALDAGKVVIIAGFQGVSDRLEITSLGRGGSDTTAVAMAAALDADYVEICSDVDGVYSADPRLTPNAQRIEELSYDEMQVLADRGAKVLNAEAVEWAKRSGVEVRCVATHDTSRTGTSISAALHNPKRGYSHQQLLAVTHHSELMKISGVGTIPHHISTCLKEFGAVDVEVYQLTSFHPKDQSQKSNWECWISLINMHQLDQLTDALMQLGAQNIEQGWSWVTLVGRSLLSVTVPKASLDHDHDESRSEVNLLEKEANGSRAGYDVVERAETIMRGAHLSAIPLSFTSSALRWAIPLAEAPKAVQLLQDQLISSQLNSHIT